MFSKEFIVKGFSRFYAEVVLKMPHMLVLLDSSLTKQRNRNLTYSAIQPKGNHIS